MNGHKTGLDVVAELLLRSLPPWDEATDSPLSPAPAAPTKRPAAPPRTEPYRAPCAGKPVKAKRARRGKP